MNEINISLPIGFNNVGTFYIYYFKEVHSYERLKRGNLDEVYFTTKNNKVIGFEIIKQECDSWVIQKGKTDELVLFPGFSFEDENDYEDNILIGNQEINSSGRDICPITKEYFFTYESAKNMALYLNKTKGKNIKSL